MAMSLQTLLKVRTLQAALHAKAKGSPSFTVAGRTGASKAYRAVDRHTAQRLRQWLRKKHKVRGLGTTRYPDAYLYQKLNLIRLEVRTRNFAWAKA